MRKTTKLGDSVWEIEFDAVADARGSFGRLFCKSSFLIAGLDFEWTQVNFSKTQHLGSVRGMHFQRAPFAEAKLVRCLNGRVFDVAVDLREKSATFGVWYSVELCAEKNNAVLIPEGFAHGFQTLTPDVTMIYFHSKDYAPSHEGGISAFDDTLGIEWPLEASRVSDRDLLLPNLENTDPIAL